jgi:acyl-CoA dehydrogenase
MDFTVSKRAVEKAQAVRAFIERHLHPIELNYPHTFRLEPEFRQRLRERAMAEGLWALHMPASLGGGGLSLLEICAVYEEMAQVSIGQDVFGSHAPDAPNMVLLDGLGTDAQKDKYLTGLMQGTLSSCIAMTEPDAAGSDPRTIQTVATRTDAGWSITGRKWLVGGAMDADFYVVMAKTDSDVPDMHADDCEDEVAFEHCSVSDDAVLGRPGDGFAAGQQRLAFARLTHAMRWVGMAVRCQRLAIEHAAADRRSMGRRLGEHGQVQAMIADNAVDIHASRLIVLNAAWNADRGADMRHLASITKLHSSEMLGRVADRSLQILGGRGYTCDTPLEKIYRTARAGRIYDGPSEIHRYVIARNLLKGHTRHDPGLAVEP